MAGCVIRQVFEQRADFVFRASHRSSLQWFEQRRGRDAVPGFFASLADFEFVRFEPFAFLEGDNMVAVPVHLELVYKASGKRIRDLEMHLWRFGSDGLVTGFRHFVDTQQFAQATRA